MAVDGLNLNIVQTVHIIHILLELVLIRVQDFPLVPKRAALLSPSDQVTKAGSVVLHSRHGLQKKIKL